VKYMNSQTRESICKGCNIYEVCLKHSNGNDVGSCPCSTCLIKMMCGKGCDDYLDFRARVHESYILMTNRQTPKERVMANRETICKGCKIYVVHKNCNFLPIIYKGSNKERICPCSTCLIKMVCDSDLDLECAMLNSYSKVMTPIRDRIFKGEYPLRTHPRIEGEPT